MDFAKKLLECLGLNDRLDYVSMALPRISRGVPGILLRNFLGTPEMILWYSWGTSRIYFNIYYAPEALLEQLAVLLFFIVILGPSWTFVALLGRGKEGRGFWTIYCILGMLLEHLAKALAPPYLDKRGLYCHYYIMLKHNRLVRLTSFWSNGNNITERLFMAYDHCHSLLWPQDIRIDKSHRDCRCYHSLLWPMATMLL